MTTTLVTFLMAITLNMRTGEEVSRTMLAGPFKTELECAQAQFDPKHPQFQYPKADGTVTVLNCVSVSRENLT